MRRRVRPRGHRGRARRRGRRTDRRDDAFAAAENRNAVLDGAKKGASIGAGVLIGSTTLGLGASTFAAETTNVGLDEIDKEHIKGPLMDRVREYVEDGVKVDERR
ncbi:hypothetical protein [Stackebrandtia nassauensis]|uniref:Uncharacterized protein n=1 Tax=Stackebrandtia nassauensis (strain DSM 44728 / CIP 108903 / NRRL B-16338 / NBRC 102104 / LLR-40K-21) TaxID=446470 RepID=D3PY99_STANL|nr:hypothetical protein [Stackebrandtia nassauensis]ADD41466.1 hypothetical protein Snas_1769 [Stackebrandtia nassauensis DSM 44728]